MRVQTGVVRLLNWYRQAGHLQADTDPLAGEPPPPCPLLALENFGLSEPDLDRTVDGSMYFGLNGPVVLRDLIDTLKTTYCGTTGIEYMHIDSIEVRKWIASRVEPTCNRPMLKLRQKYRILMTLHEAELFERFLHTKYVGQKRFSLEGGETLIPILDAIVEKGPALGVKEVVIGMAHRGRLNVLANTLHKPFSEIFNEFEDNYLPLSTHDGDGDVKYHLGFSADTVTAEGQKVHLSVAPNPSHLEIVNPVVAGRVRAKQRQHGDKDRSTGVPVLVHGDAAFSYESPDRYDAEVFIRFGADSLNFYEYRTPIRPGWDPANEINIAFDRITALKAVRDSLGSIYRVTIDGGSPGATYAVQGNPSLRSLAEIAGALAKPAAINVATEAVGELATGEHKLDPERLAYHRRLFQGDLVNPF